jgi:hypothetical protein
MGSLSTSKAIIANTLSTISHHPRKRRGRKIYRQFFSEFEVVSVKILECAGENVYLLKIRKEPRPRGYAKKELRNPKDQTRTAESYIPDV